MSTANKYMQSASGVGGAALDVDDVFSTYLYEGNSTNSRNIVNDIDVSGEGGLVWIKDRTVGDSHSLFTTDRGANKTLLTNEADAEDTVGTSVFESFNSDGFTVGSHGRTNENNRDYASWTFRKAPKFFDVVTWTGSDSGNVVKSHNLGSVPGMIMVKNLSSNTNWSVFHRSLTNGLGTGRVFLNNTNAEDNTNVQFLTADSSNLTLIHSLVKTGGENYVAYLFAHNNNDGTFGPDGDADIIKCGSYTGNGSSTGPEIDLGFEPQWLMIKNTTDSDPWLIFDAMRGLPVTGTDTVLLANASSSETNDWSGYSLTIEPTATGFKIVSSLGYVNNNNTNLIYIAIRRGPLAPPESATEVFDVGDASETGSSAPEYEGGFVVDMAIKRIMSASQPNYVIDRLRGGQSLRTDTTAAEGAFGAAKFDYMTGYYDDTSTSNSNWSAMWKRAPNYFDVVSWKVDGTGDQTIKHNLGVVPEMVWSKNRNSTSSTYNWWVVAHKDLTGWDSSNENDRHVLRLDSTASSAQQGYHRDFTDTSIRMLSVASGGYTTTDSVIAYLFASLDGVSKVGSVTHSGTTNVDCGFSAGSRFVLLKRTDSAGNWFVFDTNRGIVSGNDPYFLLNTNGAPTTNDDYIDPLSSGFTMTSSLTAGDYIFYAIA